MRDVEAGDGFIEEKPHRPLIGDRAAGLGEGAGKVDALAFAA
jgi:hypothetical protein